ncbi:exopolysaccharide biosynthesis polyprenyl glycosylphosphotransferase [Lutibacter sp. Hel_I_33_5]|uniref:exopolysaccharide biosynthesis polyprenyl glycosylphosphotransferase n=1 Tax=Lutibacter sp. Hel_I_33_5 TaxID=1566289 RepID=UPI0011AA09A2|nr:exopolysaccharide biosynthesis polyprenyl glycosylphosphotransferase [Lutibacter sp. Hel_I_33_5]TVZ54875.1 exopolysaccharide biosynthesis polyprenyl glycosylphosphotransferase [Lutibacter sp. Hel_I_33_5]
MSKSFSHINISERKLLLRFFDVLFPLFFLWITSVYSDYAYFNFSNPKILVWCLVLSFYIVLFGEIFQLYNLKTTYSRYIVFRNVFITSLVVTIAYIFTPIVSPLLPHERVHILYFFLLITFSIFSWRILYLAVLYKPKYFKSIVIIGGKENVKRLLSIINVKQQHNIINYISDTNIDESDKFLDINNVNIYDECLNANVSEVIVSTDNLSNELTNKLNKEMILLFEKGINITSFESYYEDNTDRIPKEYLDHNFYKKISYSENNYNRMYLFIHRVVDVLVSIFGLISFLLILPFIFVGNLLGNRGSIFYTQERVGLKGEKFKIYKLRSMVSNAEQNGAVWAVKNDVRITSFGKFLRKTRLDEVPQFINILKGEMSLIGPRPERPEFVDKLKKEIPFYAIRNVIRPGLTGWAQVNYPYANTIEEQEKKLRYDLYYIKERSTFLDFKVLIKTISTILLFKGQ